MQNIELKELLKDSEAPEKLEFIMDFGSISTLIKISTN